MSEVQELAPDQARRLTDRIKVAIEGTWQLIQEAYLTRAWAALGYATWDEYCTREFGTSRLRLPREERQEVVGSLRDAGLSTRAIAAATGISKNTVTEDLREVSQIGTVAQVTGMNGKTYAATQPPRPMPSSIRQPDAIPAPAPDADLLSGRPWTPAPPSAPAPAFQPAPRPMPAPPALTPEEREERIRLVAKQSHLNAYSGAVDGLIALESYAAAYTPPAEIPGHYPALPVVIGRIEAVLSTWKNWNATR